MATLQESLRDWQDFDVASYHLGVALGMFDPIGTGGFLGNVPKGVFWSNNHISTVLGSILSGLVAEGILEENEDNQFRWRQYCVLKTLG